jgi:hypothetical protein
MKNSPLFPRSPAVGAFSIFVLAAVDDKRYPAKGKAEEEQDGKKDPPAGGDFLLHLRRSFVLAKRTGDGHGILLQDRDPRKSLGVGSLVRRGLSD